MKAYKKNYLGNGQEVVTRSGAKLDIVKVVLSVDEMLQFVHQHKGEDYVAFEVARMKQANDYGDTHTVYHSSWEEVKVEAPTPAPKKKRGRPTNAEVAERLAAAEKAKNRQDLTDIPANAETLAEKAEFSNNHCLFVSKDILQSHTNNIRNIHPALVLILCYSFHIHRRIDKRQSAFLLLLFDARNLGRSELIYK